MTGTHWSLTQGTQDQAASSANVLRWASLLAHNNNKNASITRWQDQFCPGTTWILRAEGNGEFRQAILTFAICDRAHIHNPIDGVSLAWINCCHSLYRNRPHHRARSKSVIMDSYITPPYTPLFPANPTSNTAPLVPTSSSPLPHAHRVPPRFPYHIDDDAEIIFNITNPGNLPNGTAVTDSSGTLRVVRWGELPQTVEFHLDWTLEKVAYEVNSVSVGGPCPRSCPIPSDPVLINSGVTGYSD